MALLLFIAFLLVPVIELYVIVSVAGSIGVVPTLALLVAVSVFGAYMVRREGLGVLTRARRLLRSGELPTDEILDGILVLVAGALLLTPGFVTDAVGLALLIPPVRALGHRFMGRRFLRWLSLPFAAGSAAMRSAAVRAGRRVNVGTAVIVTDAAPVPPRTPGRYSGPAGVGPSHRQPSDRQPSDRQPGDRWGM
jgi:UPF0716 protein FxsA